MKKELLLSRFSTCNLLSHSPALGQRQVFGQEQTDGAGPNTSERLVSICGCKVIGDGRGCDRYSCPRMETNSSPV